ncbi:MAG: MFS transporter [Verrucomicrobia bacterium]|nr:MFS transporter [Verrucomicrobiota bacterium]
MRTNHPLHYAWIIVAITFLTLIVTAAVRATPTILIVPLESEFGWSRATISLPISINLLLYGLIGPFAAGFLYRYGVRRMMLSSIVLLVIGVSLTTLVRASWQLVLLWGLVIGTGTGMTALVLGTVVVHRWFAERHGFIIGILTASSATGQLLFLPLLAQVVQDHGWRPAVGVVVAALVLALLIVWIWMKEQPSDLGLRALGAQESDRAVVNSTKRNAFSEAFIALRIGSRSKDFWLLAGTFFICGASTNGLIGTHLVPACIDHGMLEVEGAGLLAVMGVFDLLGTTASGWLSDRLSNRWLLFMYYGLRGVSLLFLPIAFDPTTHRLPIFAVFYGLDWIATVPPTVALIARIFGSEKVGLMFGWIFAAHQVGAGFTAFFAGFLRSMEGSYDHAFFISGLLCIVAAVAVLQIGKQRLERPIFENPLKAGGAAL